jgi:hypothetical protein
MKPPGYFTFPAARFTSLSARGICRMCEWVEPFASLGRI